MIKSTDRVQNESIIFIINSDIYPREVIYATAQVFAEKFYIFLKQDKNYKITVELQPKNKIDFSKKIIKGEFYNELLNTNLRYEINKNNKQIREYIVRQALIGADPKMHKKIKKKKSLNNKEIRSLLEKEIKNLST